jgi:REP element-mobilizing transposase RayT
MQLNVLGEIVKDCLMEVPRHFADVEIPVYAIMPNHLHSILVLRERARHAVPLLNSEVQLNRSEHAQKFGEPVAGSVPTIVRSFKSAVTREARITLKNRSLEMWQRNYFERVIRSTDEFRKTWQYTCENPARWDFDPENPQKRQ